MFRGSGHERCLAGSCRDDYLVAEGYEDKFRWDRDFMVVSPLPAKTVYVTRLYEHKVISTHVQHSVMRDHAVAKCIRKELVETCTTQYRPQSDPAESSTLRRVHNTHYSRSS